MLVDSHCHLDRVDLKHYQEDFSQLIDATGESGVGHMLCVSIDMEAYPAMLALVEPFSNISVSVGVHPTAEGREASAEELVRLAEHDKNIAIGETGLDYFHGKGDLEWQRERFRTHIRAARLANKPLIIHTREAREDTIRILREEQAEQVGGVMHCFTETWEMAQQAMEMGFYVSFSGIVTFKNAVELKAVAKKIPSERLLIETDSPYLAPVPHRGKPNQPKWVGHVAQYLAELRGEPYEALVAQTADNFFRLFSHAQKRLAV